MPHKWEEFGIVYMCFECGETYPTNKPCVKDAIYQPRKEEMPEAPFTMPAKPFNDFTEDDFRNLDDLTLETMVNMRPSTPSEWRKWVVEGGGNPEIYALMAVEYKLRAERRKQPDKNQDTPPAPKDWDGRCLMMLEIAATTRYQLVAALKIIALEVEGGLTLRSSNQSDGFSGHFKITLRK